MLKSPRVTSTIESVSKQKIFLKKNYRNSSTTQVEFCGILQFMQEKLPKDLHVRSNRIIWLLLGLYIQQVIESYGIAHSK